MLKRLLMLLVILAACVFMGAPAGLARDLELTAEEEAQMRHEPPITAAELDLLIKYGPRFMEAVNDAETLAIAKEIGWSKVRQVTINNKLAMAYVFLTNPEVYDMLVEAELFGEGLTLDQNEIAVVKARMPELEALFAEYDESSAD